jgi:uncharacterized membrane protein YgaE (UPF0421/DUF939 family)
MAVTEKIPLLEDVVARILNFPIGYIFTVLTSLYIFPYTDYIEKIKKKRNKINPQVSGTLGYP